MILCAMLAERITSPSTDLSSPKMPTPSESSKSTRFHQDTRDLAPKRISEANRVGYPRAFIDFYTLCFHGLTNPFSSNPFPFTSIQNGGRAKSTGFKPKWKSVRQVSNAE